MGIIKLFHKLKIGFVRIGRTSIPYTTQAKNTNETAVFENMPSLESLRLDSIKLVDKSFDFLKTLPELTEFNFEAGMFT